MEDGIQISNSDVAVLLTTFNPDIVVLKSNMESYVHQVSMVIVCDNSDSQAVRDQIRKICEEKDSVFYYSLGGNKGVAAAQNFGVKVASENGIYYYVEMDQDTNLPGDYVKQIIASYSNLIGQGCLLAGIGPLAVSQLQGFVYHGYKPGAGLVKVDKAMSSGFFYSKYAFDIVGPKDESLFIDYVDWEWCWRASNSSLDVYIDTHIHVEHNLGEGHVKIGPWRIGVPAPVRHYYQYRNGLNMISRSYVPLSWKVRRIVIYGLKFFYYSFGTKDCARRRFYIKRGVLDFLRRKYGQFE